MQVFAIILLGLLCVDSALASAGKVLFAAGPVTIEASTVRSAAVGDLFNTGDTIATGEKARAQLLMNDGARIALRSGSRFRIDEFSLPAAVTAPVKATTANASGKAVASLLKGGFRTTTGAIGKDDPAAYAVRTPVGTLGIRGTHYVVVWCTGDCTDAPGLQPGEVIRDGLYIAVDEGVVVFQYGGREIRLASGQVFFIPAGGGEPEALDRPPAWLEGDGAGNFRLVGGGGGRKASETQLPGISDRRKPTGDPALPGSRDGQPDGGVDQQIQGTTPDGQTIDLTPGNPQGAQRRDVAWSIARLTTAPNGTVSVESVPASGYTLDGNGNLMRFAGTLPPTVPATFELGAATVVDAAGSPTAILRWGRWTGGVMVVTANGLPSGENIAQQSLHWLMSGNAGAPPVIPITGSATYALVGSTSPTDDLGAVGSLGSATFVADFDTREVTSTLALDINSTPWSASGTGAIGNQVALPDQQFSGSYDTILINGSPSTAVGVFQGFFSGPAAGPAGAPAGAGLSYNLIDGQTGLQVTGTAAFITP